jgi:lysozyme family protein
MRRVFPVSIFFISMFHWTTAAEAPVKSIVVKHKASFLVAYGMVRSHEGGYANVSNDLGGETYCGISRIFHKEWQGWYRIDEYKQLNGTPTWNYYFKDITEWHVTEFYLDIWVKEGFFDLENQAIANYLFDFRIHSPLAIRIIQQQLNKCGHHFELDNLMNSKMIDALNKTDSNKFLKLIRERRIDFYKKIVDRYPNQKKFLSHWIKRANV